MDQGYWIVCRQQRSSAGYETRTNCVESSSPVRALTERTAAREGLRPKPRSASHGKRVLTPEQSKCCSRARARQRARGGRGRASGDVEQDSTWL